MMKSSYELRAPLASRERAPKTEFERIGDQHVLMMRYVRSLARGGRKPGELERLDPRIMYPEDYEGMAFRPDLYVVEPAVIDDLEDAKKKRDEARVEGLRSAIRAMSWASHGRTDDEVAARLVSEFLHRADTRETQRGFEYSQTEVAEWTRVLNTLRKDARTKLAPCGDAVEEPTRFVEKKVVEAWKQLLADKKKGGSAWPTSYPVAVDPPKLSESVRHANDRLVNLRHIRDQLYFWRLYPRHCMYARNAK
ncbi:MAG: hypothetical protein NUW08_01955 [Candidatus Uhrbacteria bacterium]|nr:hypothetical protein [Candidatus Uhrbacteria bacterium]